MTAMTISNRPARSRMITAALLLTCATASLASFATAGDDQARRMVVAYSDLNLESFAGNQQLYQRIRNAAKRVCNESNDSRLEARARQASCERNAIDNAVREIKSSKLAALHQANRVG